MTDILGIDRKVMSCGEKTNGCNSVIIEGRSQSYINYEVNVILCDFIIYVFIGKLTLARVHVYIHKLMWDWITLYDCLILRAT